MVVAFEQTAGWSLKVDGVYLKELFEYIFQNLLFEAFFQRKFHSTW